MIALHLALQNLAPGGITPALLAATATLPTCTLMEATILAVGESESRAALLAQKPHLQPIEDFINEYIF